MHNIIKKGYRIIFKVLGLVAILVLIKLLFHALNFEIISLNALFTGIIGANVFLLSFLLSGVLTDYKESEKIPGEMAAIFSTLADEYDTAFQLKQNPVLREGLQESLALNEAIVQWLHKKMKTQALMQQFNHLYLSISQLETVLAPNYIVRMKQEHHNLRKFIIRIHTIRETDFISSGYLIATTTTTLLLIGLLLIKIEPFMESLFFIGVISYVMIFLIVLIRDLDNPFGFYENDSSEDVSIKPLEDSCADIKSRL
ncbi:MAG: hypothetical protein WCL54_06840 [Clostridia bacterium]